jgi:cysteine desulfuration protein SufE
MPEVAVARFEEIAEDFSILDDWEDRYRYVIDLGKTLKPLDDGFRVKANKVDGCASQVWISPRFVDDGGGAAFDFDGDSDAMIVRGLIAVLHALYSGLSARDVLDVDAGGELAGLGLDQHLSSQRSNGLRAMVARIREISQARLQQA